MALGNVFQKITEYMSFPAVASPEFQLGGGANKDLKIYINLHENLKIL